MKYLLLTGATGLLGEYLLRDLTRVGVRLAVVARGSGRRSAVSRIEAIFGKLETAERRCLPRPVVLEGDLHQPRFGLDRKSVKWIGEHCDRFLHNAASLQFLADSKTGEPYRSNVDGTRHMLELCRETGIGCLHHVSTAYVCGGRRGLIQESDPIDEVSAGNDYEISKIRSEQMIQEFASEGNLNQLTIYRPAIIVGDHRTGYTSTFHGFYVPLQLAGAIRAASHGQRGLPPELLMGSLGLTGNEQKNFVPVDWVSEVIASGVADSSGRFISQTLHLVPGRRVSVGEMTSAIVDALADAGAETKQGSSVDLNADASSFLDFFKKQMQVYQAYWRDDPEFDCSTTTALLPDLPCPTVDHASMLRLCRYAIKTNYGARRGLPAPEVSRIGSVLSLGDEITASDGVNRLGCCITGAGGGDFELRWSGNRFNILRGLPQQRCLGLRMNRPTFDRLATGELTTATAIRRGCIAITDSDTGLDVERLAVAMKALIECDRVETFQGTLQ